MPQYFASERRFKEKQNKKNIYLTLALQDMKKKNLNLHSFNKAP